MARFSDANTNGFSDFDLAALNTAFSEVTALGDLPESSDSLTTGSLLDYIAENLLVAYDAGKRGDDLITAGCQGSGISTESVTVTFTPDLLGLLRQGFDAGMPDDAALAELELGFTRRTLDTLSEKLRGTTGQLCLTPIEGMALECCFTAGTEYDDDVPEEPYNAVLNILRTANPSGRTEGIGHH